MELTQLFLALKGAPTEFVTAIALASIIIALVLRLKKTDIDGFTSINKAQQETLATLMAQNKQLSDELSKLREEIAEQYSLIQKLRQQVDHLERQIREYQKKCDTCPGPPPPPRMGMLLEIPE